MCKTEISHYNEQSASKFEDNFNIWKEVTHLLSYDTSTTLSSLNLLVSVETEMQTKHEQSIDL